MYYSDTPYDATNFAKLVMLRKVVAVLWSTACVTLVGFALCLHVSLNGVSPP